MKVLIETITNRTGYKFFENREEMDAYLGRHCGKIASYEILQEDDAAEETNEMLQSFIDDCDLIEKKLFWLFRQYEPINEEYSLQLLNAFGRVGDGRNAIKKCLRQLLFCWFSDSQYTAIIHQQFSNSWLNP